MAKLVFEMNQTVDGYVDHDGIPSNPLFRHWTERTQGLTGSIYGRIMYETMRYWDEDRPEWDAAQRVFAQAWRRQPKWVVSRSLGEVGPNATLIREDVAATVGRIKASHKGEIVVAGPYLANSLAWSALIDEYRLYIHPFVTGRNKPFFLGPTPPLRLVANEVIIGDVVRLTYAPA